MFTLSPPKVLGYLGAWSVGRCRKATRGQSGHGREPLRDDLDMIHVAFVPLSLCRTLFKLAIHTIASEKDYLSPFYGVLACMALLATCLLE